MSAEKMKIRFYPVGNGDSSLIENEDGRHLLIDYNCPDEAKDDDDERIDLEVELDGRLRDKDLDVLMITHSHEDHYGGFSDYFWLNFAQKYQGDDRRKFTELWVPDAMIWETGINGEGKILQKEARYRLLDERRGIKIFGESDSLIEFIEQSVKARYGDVKHLIFRPGEVINHFSGFELFIHSPHSWKTEDDENKNNKSIVVQADFRIDYRSVAKVIFGSDAESDAWGNIYSSTENNVNLDRLEFDVFKLSHHCSHTALNKDEKGDLITEPVENVKKLFENQGQNKCKLIASCKKIPSMSKRNEPGPPHYQAAEYYRKIAGDKGGEFEVTMEQAMGANSRKPIIVEITKFGPRIILLSAGAIGAGKVTSKKTERFG
jgi:ribonuclease BN (tRNA processing enzyme)